MKNIVYGTVLPLLMLSMLFPAIEPIASVETSYIHVESLTPSEEQIIALVNGSRAYNYDLTLENIAYQHPDFRSAGSIGANETANWIKQQFSSFGLEAWLEPFEFTNWTLRDQPSLIIDQDGNQSTLGDQVEIGSFQCEHYSWPTPDEGVFSDLVILPLPPAADHTELGKNTINMTIWDAIDTTGKVLLIGREVRMTPKWAPTFINKLYAQPPAAVVYTWWYSWISFTPILYSSAGGLPMGGGYYWDLSIPVGSVNYNDGLWIRNRENANPNLAANVTIKSVINSDGTHYNVVGRIVGYEQPEKIVIISAHYDTVMCSGFCDNGAGTAGIMELAKVVSEAIENRLYKPSYTLLFVAFAAEELYLVGSAHYVKQHKNEMTNITAVINLDCIGSNDLYVSQTPESTLEQTIVQAAQDLGISIITEPPGGSDHESFLDPSYVNDLILWNWGVNLGISDAAPVKSSAMIDSYPLFYRDLWDMGEAGWIHTLYDNSTSTATLDWVETQDLENHIEVAALSIVRVSPSVEYPVDIAVISVSPSGTVVGQGYSMPINVTVQNQGDYTEVFDVTIYANMTIIQTASNVTLASESSTTLTFIWNTTGFIKSRYIISAYAWPLPDEIDTEDNRKTDGSLLVSKVGDIGSGLPPQFFQCDGKVDGKDLALFLQCYKGSAPPNAMYLGDLGGGLPPQFYQCDGKVDGKDLALFLQCYKGLGPPDP